MRIIQEIISEVNFDIGDRFWVITSKDVEEFPEIKGLKYDIVTQNGFNEFQVALPKEVSRSEFINYLRKVLTTDFKVQELNGDPPSDQLRFVKRNSERFMKKFVIHKDLWSDEGETYRLAVEGPDGRGALNIRRYIKVPKSVCPSSVSSQGSLKIEIPRWLLKDRGVLYPPDHIKGW